MNAQRGIKPEDLRRENLRKAALWFRAVTSVPHGPFGIDDFQRGIEAQTFKRQHGGLEVTVDLKHLDKFRASELRYDPITQNMSSKSAAIIDGDFSARFGRGPKIDISSPDTVKFLFDSSFVEQMSREFDKAVKDTDFKKCVEASGDIVIDSTRLPGHRGYLDISSLN